MTNVISIFTANSSRAGNPFEHVSLIAYREIFMTYFPGGWTPYIRLLHRPPKTPNGDLNFCKKGVLIYILLKGGFLADIFGQKGGCLSDSKWIVSKHQKWRPPFYHTHFSHTYNKK